MVTDDSQDANGIQATEEVQEREKQVSTLLSDSTLRDMLIEKLTEGGHVAKQDTPNQQKDRFNQSGNPFGSGGWPNFPMQFPFYPFPHPAWGSPHNPPVAAGAGSSQFPHGSALASGQPGFSRGQGQEEGEDDDEEDYVNCWMTRKPWSWSSLSQLLMKMTPGLPVTQLTTLFRSASIRRSQPKQEIRTTPSLRMKLSLLHLEPQEPP